MNSIPTAIEFGDKQFLGATIKSGGISEADQAIHILAAEPPTAHHVSTELAEFFCCDAPPDASDSGDDRDLAGQRWRYQQVLATMFASPEFKASLAQKFKDPIHYAVSALRATYGNQVILNPQPLLNWLNRMGEPLYGHETPDGYPMTEGGLVRPGRNGNPL